MSKANGPPKCKLCGHEHWLGQSHFFATPTVASVPYATRNVALDVPESEMIAASLAPEHECPICGLFHHRPMTSTERSRMRRQRQENAARGERECMIH